MLFSVTVVAQTEEEQEKYRMIAGVCRNPLIVYDFDGNIDEYIRLHAVLGVLFKNKIYTSLGYTAVANAFCNFNEYCFVVLHRKVPVSWWIAEEYMLNKNKFISQTGLNIKLSKIGNLYFFLFTPVDNFSLGLKVGVFIPLNVVLKKG
jgi:hypothetical protein